MFVATLLVGMFCLFWSHSGSFPDVVAVPANGPIVSALSTVDRCQGVVFACFCWRMPSRPWCLEAGTGQTKYELRTQESICLRVVAKLYPALRFLNIVLRVLLLFQAILVYERSPASGMCALFRLYEGLVCDWVRWFEVGKNSGSEQHRSPLA